MSLFVLCHINFCRYFQFIGYNMLVRYGFIKVAKSLLNKIVLRVNGFAPCDS